MKKISIILIFCITILLFQPVASSKNDSYTDSNELCGIASVILIIVVLIIGIFIYITDLKKKTEIKIEKKHKSTEYCPNCDREIYYNDEFCQHCGYKIK